MHPGSGQGADMAAFSFDDLAEARPGLIRRAHAFADYQDVEDLVGDTLLRAWRARETFSGGSLGAWLYVLMRNIARDNGRRASIRRSVPFNEDFHDRATPASQEVGIELRDVLSAVRRLPEGHQQALKLVVGGMSYEGTAERMGIPLGTVRSRLFRARQTLSGDAR